MRKRKVSLLLLCATIGVISLLLFMPKVNTAIIYLYSILIIWMLYNAYNLWLKKSFVKDVDWTYNQIINGMCKNLIRGLLIGSCAVAFYYTWYGVAVLVLFAPQGEINFHYLFLSALWTAIVFRYEKIALRKRKKKSTIYSNDELMRKAKLRKIIEEHFVKNPDVFVDCLKELKIDKMQRLN